MTEKTVSLATQAYDKIKENILNLTYPPGMPLTEAMLAAVYLDGGMEAVRPIIRRLILDKEREKSAGRDYKTALQELVQRTPGAAVSYALVRESGPDHCRSFEMEASVDGKVIGAGAGRTKKEAEQMAAKAALEKLKG